MTSSMILMVGACAVVVSRPECCVYRQGSVGVRLRLPHVALAGLTRDTATLPRVHG